MCQRGPRRRLKSRGENEKSRWPVALLILVGDGLVGGGHEGRALDGRDHLARAAHAVNALLAGIGTELSDVPSRVGHARIIEDLGDGRQAVPVAGAQHVLVDDAAGLAHLQVVDVVAVLHEAEAREHRELGLPVDVKNDNLLNNCSRHRESEAMWPINSDRAI